MLDRTLTDLAALLRGGELSPTELMDRTLARIEERNPEVNAFTEVFTESARESARRATQEIADGNVRGPLHGIPVAVKENIDVAGTPTPAGSRLLPGEPATADAAVIGTVTGAGMVPLGHTGMQELALGVTGLNPHVPSVRNPRDPSLLPGGSSSGSAAALAAHMCHAAIGTDTGGSVRIPSACCGTVGLKPTLGLVPTTGVVPLSWTLDHVGPMARNLADCELLFEQMVPGVPTGPAELGRPPRIGVLRTALEGVDRTVADDFERTLGELSATGAELVDVEFPNLDEVYFTANVITCVEAAALHSERLAGSPEGLGDEVRLFLLLGAAITGVDHVQALRLRTRLTEQLSALLSTVDVITMPTIPTLAPTVAEPRLNEAGEEFDVTDEFTTLPSLTNVTGHPSLSVPMGTNWGSSIQFVGPHGSDRILFEVARPVPEV